VLRPVGFGYGEELLDPSWRGACPWELPGPRVGLASRVSQPQLASSKGSFFLGDLG
jgi:hypothetical protein